LSRVLCVPVPLTHRELQFRFRVLNKEMVWVEGISAMTSDHQYVIFLDYDGALPAFVVDDVKILQEEFGLGRGYIFQTGRRNFHTIIPEKYALCRVHEVLSRSASDRTHVEAYRLNKYRTWVLRCGPKGERPPPVYVGCVPSSLPDNLKSLGHLIYLQKAGAGADVLLEPNDGYSTVIKSYYKTKHW